MPSQPVRLFQGDEVCGGGIHSTVEKVKSDLKPMCVSSTLHVYFTSAVAGRAVWQGDGFADSVLWLELLVISGVFVA